MTFVAGVAAGVPVVRAKHGRGRRGGAGPGIDRDLLVKGRPSTDFRAGACFAAAVGYGAAARERALNSPLAAWLDAHAPNGRLEVPARVEGTIAEDASVSDAGVRLTIDVDRLAVDRDWLVMNGRLQVTVAGAIAFARATQHGGQAGEPWCP